MLKSAISNQFQRVCVAKGKFFVPTHFAEQRKKLHFLYTGGSSLAASHTTINNQNF